MQLLFVDDEPNVLSGLQRLLRPYRQRWEMRFALGGERALEYLEETPVDVLVTDVRMPGLDGMALLQIVRERSPGTIRIVLSGQVDADSAIGLSSVAHQFLSKPCDPDVLVAALTRATSQRTQLTDPQLRKALGRLESLPSPRPVVQELSAVLARPDATIDDVVAVVEQDPAMTVKVLQLVNSAFFGLPRQARSVREGVVFLGVAMVRSLVTATDIFHGFEESPDLDPGFFAAVRESCLQVAEASRALAAPADQSDAYLGGLVHDVGLLALAVCRPEQLASVFRTARETGTSFLALEEDAFGTGHAEIGAHLLAIWGLRDSIVEATAFHHSPDCLPSDATIGRVVAEAVARVDTFDHEVSP